MHFASRRLRVEAHEDLQKLHQQVASTMTILKRADRANNINYEKEKEETLLKLKQMEQQLAIAQAAAREAQLEAERLRGAAAA